MLTATHKTFLVLVILLAVILIGGCRKSLHEAVESHDLKTVKRLIRDGADVNARNKDGQTPLHIAALVARADIANLLIEGGADINAKEEHGWTPLHQACANSRWAASVAELLISKGADIHTVTNDGYAPLHAAARGGNAGLVRLLIEKGADVNAQTKSGDTPLHWAAQACRYDQAETVEALLSAGAEVLVKNKVGFTPLESALTWDNQVIADLFVKTLDLDATDESGDSLLHWAVRRHNAELVNLFIEHGADINVTDGQSRTPLDVALLIRNKDIIDLLESRGAQKTHKEKPVISPGISQEELLLYVRNVVSEGGDINAPHKLGAPPLYIASMFGYKDAVNFLLNNGASANSTVNKGYTPLHVATQYSQFEVAKLLIDCGANVNAVANEDRLTPLHLALMAKKKDLKLVHLLISHDANVNAVIHKDRRTPLHMAVMANERSLAELLIESGADLNAAGPLGGQTPLHMSVLYGNIPLTMLLLTKGADVNAQDLGGSTPRSSRTRTQRHSGTSNQKWRRS
jgi:cytohesin